MPSSSSSTDLCDGRSSLGAVACGVVDPLRVNPFTVRHLRKRENGRQFGPGLSRSAGGARRRYSHTRRRPRLRNGVLRGSDPLVASIRGRPMASFMMRFTPRHSARKVLGGRRRDRLRSQGLGDQLRVDGWWWERRGNVDGGGGGKSLGSSKGKGGDDSASTAAMRNGSARRRGTRSRTFLCGRSVQRTPHRIGQCRGGLAAARAANAPSITRRQQGRRLHRGRRVRRDRSPVRRDQVCVPAGQGAKRTRAACRMRTVMSGLRCGIVGFGAQCVPEGTSDVGQSCALSGDCYAGLPSALRR